MAAVTLGLAIVFALIGVALILFVSEALPADVTAIGVLVVLAVLEPGPACRHGRPSPGSPARRR